MKLTVANKQGSNGEYLDLDALIERGRQLHSKAVFEMCAKIFHKNKYSQTTFNTENKNIRLVDSH